MAGYNFTLTCSVTLSDGLTGLPNVMWVDSFGRSVNSSGDLIAHDPVTSGQATRLTLFFDPLRTSDEGAYTCVARVSSPASTLPLNSSALYVIDAQQSELYFMYTSNNLYECIHALLL